MKRILISAALLSVAAIGIWMVLGVELRGYGDSLTPGGVTISSEKNRATDLNEAVIEQSMNQGVRLLHELGDPETAIRHFSVVLKHNGEHYGARYQIARAFEQTQQLRLAHLAWSKFEPMARQIGDTPSLTHAQKRIATLENRMVALEEQMKKGVDLLHVQGRPDDAVAYFEEVRSAWATHYGARYQHALALEQSGQSGAAEGAWIQFLAAAETTDNREDIQAAKAAIVRVHALQESREPR
jgi:tetratricopeptide (TPR) repeat protein